MSEWNAFEQRLKNVAICGTVSRKSDSMGKNLIVSMHVLQLLGKNQLENCLFSEMRGI